MKYLLTLALCLAALPAHAAILSATPSPSSRTAAMNAPAVIPVTWRITRNGAMGQTTIESAEVRVYLGDANGQLIYTITKPLTKTMNIVDNVVFVTFPETITIPRDITFRAAKAGQRLMLIRSFTDNSFVTSNAGEFPVNIGSPGSADFSVSRVELRFDDGSTSCRAEPGEKRTAIAKIIPTGSGLLRGSWQVREGALGSFRIVRAVSIPISAGRETIIESPAIPTGRSERLDVRFNIDSPDITTPLPTISCSVGKMDALAQKPLDEGKIAEVTSPAPDSPLNATTKISWKPVSGAKSYRIEILPGADGEPITAQMVKAGTTSATLSPLTLEKLQTAQRYTIRVMAE